MHLLSSQSGRLVCPPVKPPRALLDLGGPSRLRVVTEHHRKMEKAGAGGSRNPCSGTRGLLAWLAPGVGSRNLRPCLHHHSLTWQGKDAETLWTTRGFVLIPRLSVAGVRWPHQAPPHPTTQICPQVFQTRVASLPCALAPGLGWEWATHEPWGHRGTQSVVPCRASVSPYVTRGHLWGFRMRGKLSSLHGALPGSEPTG